MKNYNGESIKRNIKKWFYTPNPQKNVKYRVFSFHYAAVSAEVYHTWAYEFDTGIEFCCVQMPGRSTRSDESMPVDIIEFLNEVDSVISSFNTVPFVIYGHCMGGSMAYELTRIMRKNQEYLPDAIFVSGVNPPQIPVMRRDLHSLPDKELLTALKEVNFNPEDFNFTEETVCEMLPIIKGDFKLIDKWYFDDSNQKINIPIFAYGGTEDIFIPEENLKRWEECTYSAFSYKMLPGYHFFIKDKTNRNVIISDIKNFIKRKL